MTAPSLTRKAADYDRGQNNIDLETARWRKSSHSGTESACVEIAITAGTVGIRDTKNRTGGTLVIPEHTWQDLTCALKQ